MKIYSKLVFVSLVFIHFSCDKKNIEPEIIEGEFSTDYSQMFTTPKLGDVGRFIPVLDTKYGQVSDVNGNLFSQWRTVPNILGTAQTGVQWGAPGAPGQDFSVQSGSEVWQVKYDCATGHNYIFINQCR